MPKVTVLMPVYNGEEYLREAIDSILNQTFTDFEFLIMNDGSTDNSVKIIQSYQDSRIRLVHNETNLKLIKTLNKGIDLATGEYIARFDCDDISHPRRLEVQVAIMEKDKDIAVCGTNIKVIGKRFNLHRPVMGTETIRNYMLVKNVLIHPSVMMRTSTLKTNKIYYDEHYLHAEDYELFQRLSTNHKIVNIKEPLLFYRHSPGGISRIYAEDQAKMTAKISTDALEQCGIRFNRLLYMKPVLSKQEILEVKQKLEAEFSSFTDADKNIEEVFQLLWLELCRQGIQHGIWTWKTFKNSILLKHNHLNSTTVTMFFIRCLLKKG